MVDKQSQKRLLGDSEALQLHCLQSRPGGKMQKRKKKIVEREKERRRRNDDATSMSNSMSWWLKFHQWQ